jgi:hypothetical protein
MAKTNYHLYWLTFANGWNNDGSPIIWTRPVKGVSVGDAVSRLKREYTKAFLVGQATQEDIAKYKEVKSHGS